MIILTRSFCGIVAKKEQLTKFYNLAVILGVTLES